MTPAEKFDAFFRRCRDPIFFANALLPKQPHAGQRKWLEQSTAPINVLVPGNRWGKSTVEAMKHLHKAFTKEGMPGGYSRRSEYQTISVSVSADQAEIVFDEVKRLALNPAFAPFVKKVYSTPFPTMRLYNGSVINCRSAHDDGKYIDGHEYRYVSIDEAGYIKNLKNLVNGVVLMRLAGGGQLDLIGTPKGHGDLYWYYERGHRGVEGYYAQRGTIYDNPFLGKADLEMRDKLMASSDPRLRRQVFEGEFVDLSGLAFTNDQQDQMFDSSLPAHTPYVPGRRYIQAWDLGRKTDWTVGVTFDVTEPPYRMVDYTRLQRVPWEVIYDLIDQKKKEYRVALPRIDATGPQGDVIEEELWKRGIGVDPYKTSTGASKLNLINTLQAAMDYGRTIEGTRLEMDEAGMEHEVPDPEPVGGDWGLIRLPVIPQLLDEFGVYSLDDRDLVQDSVMSVALAVAQVFDGAILAPPDTSGGLYGG